MVSVVAGHAEVARLVTGDSRSIRNCRSARPTPFVPNESPLSRPEVTRLALHARRLDATADGRTASRRRHHGAGPRLPAAQSQTHPALSTSQRARASRSIAWVADGRGPLRGRDMVRHGLTAGGGLQRTGLSSVCCNRALRGSADGRRASPPTRGGPRSRVARIGRDPSLPQRRMSAAAGRRLSVNRQDRRPFVTDACARDLGDGPPLILLQVKRPRRRLSQLAGKHPRLAKRHRMIALDASRLSRLVAIRAGA